MLRDDVKSALIIAMKGKDKQGVSTLRLIMAAIKDRDIAARSKGVTDGIGDPEILSLMQSMVKQRRESISQFDAAGRTDLSDKERFELGILQEFLPAALAPAEIDQLIADAISASGAQSARDMGAVMALLRPQVQGRADMSDVSQRVKARLGG